MKYILGIFLVFLTLTNLAAKTNALTPVGKKTPVYLAKSHKALLTIVVSPNKPEDVKAAKVLKKYLDFMTKANFVITHDDKGLEDNFISVGNTELAKANGFNKIELKKDGIAVKVSNGNIFLLGNGADGIMNAVMAFLEEDLGCRWYSDKWEYLPEDENLTVQVTDRVSIPDFSMRFVFTATDLSSNAEWTRNNRVMKWNKFNHVDKWFCHTYERICSMKEFKKHPEYFAKLPNGKPFNTQLCPSHPDIIKRAKERSLAALRKNKDKKAVYLSISETDGSTGFCHCPRCNALNKKYRTPLAAHLVLVNNVARYVKNEFPDSKIEFLVYSRDFRKPPVNLKIEPNVSMWFCTTNIKKYKLYRKNKKAVKDFLQWNKLVKNTNIWEYDCDYSNYFRVVPTLYPKTENLKFWKKHKVNGMFLLEVFGTRGGDQQALRAWILSKMLWNSKLDIDKLARDFCEGVFSEAADEMYEYYQLVKKAGLAGKTVESYYGRAKFIKLANDIFSRAYRKTANNTKLKHRIDNHYIPIAFMEIDGIYKKYPANRRNFPQKRYNSLLSRIKDITTREKMKSYSELRSLAGRIAELELLKKAASGGAIGIYAVNGTLYEYPIKKDPLAFNGKAPRLPCNGNWLVQWYFPSNLFVPGKKYQLRAQLRPIKPCGNKLIGSAGVHYKVGKYRTQAISNLKSFVSRIPGGKLSNKEYRWLKIGKPFIPEKDCYVWFAADAGSGIGGLFVNRIELVPAK